MNIDWKFTVLAILIMASILISQKIAYHADLYLLKMHLCNEHLETKIGAELCLELMEEK